MWLYDAWRRRMCMDVNDDGIGSCFTRGREGKAIHRINIQNKKSSNKVITKIGNKHTKSTARRSLEESWRVGSGQTVKPAVCVKAVQSGAQTPPHDLDTGREADASWSATFRAQGIGANNQVINFVFVVELKKKPPNN